MSLSFRRTNGSGGTTPKIHADESCQYLRNADVIVCHRDELPHVDLCSVCTGRDA